MSALAATVSIATGACSSDSKSDDGADARPTTAVTALATAPSLTGIFADAQSAACDLDLAAVRAAVEFHIAANGDAQFVEAQLVADGLLTQESPLHDIGADSSVVPSPTGGCTT
jgi:hypothetical protein